MRVSLIIAVLALAGVARAAAPAPKTFPLYDAAPTGWEHPKQVELTESWPPDNHRMLRNVTAPTVTAYLPDPAKATGTGIVVFPGGGFAALSIDQEGTEVARWLADRGIAAFVVKYRLAPTVADKAAFFKDFAKLLATASPDAHLPGEDAAHEDARAAIKLVRARAASFGIGPNRIGVLGFSAGGFIALHMGLERDTHLAFVGDIYAPLDSKETVTADAPPLFSAIAADDALFKTATTASFEAWRKAGRPAELHVYEHGNHGFGMRKQGTTSDGWIDDFYRWLIASGFTKPAK